MNFNFDKTIMALILSFCTVGITNPQRILAAEKKAQVICANSGTGNLTVRNKCKNNETRLNLSSFQGPTGEQGPAGDNGSLAVYGDGSAGALTVNSTVSLETLQDDGNYQFTSCSVASGITLSVQSGTVIRCTGAVDIQGSIVVATATNSPGRVNLLGTDFIEASITQPAAGNGSSAASSGEIGKAADNFSGGTGGNATSITSVPGITLGNMRHGGGGAGAPSSTGGSGGGSFALIAKGAISIGASALISLSGGVAQNGSGGGAGGVLILASMESITQSGQILASGSDGGASTATIGAGGGGGGGIVRLISPAVTPEDGGDISINAGQNGSTVTSVVVNGTSIIAGGGGGGSCGGAGGTANTVLSNGSQAGGTSGGDGAILVTFADPTSLL